MGIPILHLRSKTTGFWRSIPVLFLKTTLDDWKEWNLEINHPVGSWWKSNDPTDPAKVLGGGVWELREDGTTLIAANQAHPVGTVCGAETHALTVDEMPVHNPGGVKSQTVVQNMARGDEPNPYGYLLNGELVPTDPIGGGQPHSIMQPSYATYIWQRVK